MKQYLPISLDHPNQAKRESWVSRRDSKRDSCRNNANSFQVTAGLQQWLKRMSKVILV